MKAYGRFIFLPNRQPYFPLIKKEEDPLFKLCSLAWRKHWDLSTVQEVQECATYWWLSLQASGKELWREMEK